LEQEERGGRGRKDFTHGRGLQCDKRGSEAKGSGAAGKGWERGKKREVEGGSPVVISKSSQEPFKISRRRCVMDHPNPPGKGGKKKGGMLAVVRKK